MAIKVIVPNKKYNANYAGVQFKKGEGIFEDEARGKMIAKVLGYKVEEIGEPVEDTVEPVEAVKEPVTPKPKRRSATRSKTKKTGE